MLFKVDSLNKDVNKLDYDHSVRVKERKYRNHKRTEEKQKKRLYYGPLFQR